MRTSFVYARRLFLDPGDVPQTQRCLLRRTRHFAWTRSVFSTTRGDPMTTTTRSLNRSIAVLKLTRSVPALITQAENIVQAMTNNPCFPSPTPSLATVSDGIHQLQVAEVATLSRTKGSAATRNEKRTALISVLQQVKNHVQTT